MYHRDVLEWHDKSTESRTMGKKNRRKNKPKQWVKATKPDEVFSNGPLKIMRYGRFIQFSNTSTPEEQAAFLENMAIEHKAIIAALTKEVAALQFLIQIYDPVEVMHRAAYVLLPLFLKYQSEYEFSGEESCSLAIVEYLQYLISRTPSKSGGRKFDEHEWDELWAAAMKVFDLTKTYLLTRRTKNSPPSEIDELRLALDYRRLMVRVRRYPIYFTDHLRDSLSPYEYAIKDAYQIDIEKLIQGLEEINSYQKTGVFDRYQALREATEAITRKLRERGFSITSSDMLERDDKIREALKAPEFEALHRDVEEKARLTLTPAIFDITEITSLPKVVLSVLSIRPGESVLTELTGPNHDDLSPLSPSPLHHKPFLTKDDRFYYFYHSGFEDRIPEIIEDDLFQRFPDRASSLRRRRDEYLESLATDLLASIIKPDSKHRNVFYPDPDQPGGLTELDALMAADDILFLVEIKAGGFSAAANRGAPNSLYDELSETIGTGQRQSERAERYIRSSDEVPFLDANGKSELLRIKQTDFRRIFRVVITREDLGWVGARISVLSMLDQTMSTSLPWHVSLDDLRIVAELFKDSELRFVHFLEQRLQASHERALRQHDEIEHIALYNKINLYHELPVKGMDRVTFDGSYMRDIDWYFSEKTRGQAPALPMQKIPARVAQFLQTLRDSHLAGRFEVASIILSMDDIGRSQLDDALKHLDSGRDEGKQRSVRLPFTSASHGLTISYAAGQFWDEELIRSAAQMEQSRCVRWLAVQLNRSAPHAVTQIQRILPGRFSERELMRGRAYLEQTVRKTIEARAIGRNDPCPCSSGKKYKKCHGR